MSSSVSKKKISPDGVSPDQAVERLGKAVTAALAMRVRDGEESEAMAIAGIAVTFWPPALTRWCGCG